MTGWTQVKACTFGLAGALVALLLAWAPATAQTPSTVAPTGTLRAAFLGGNPVHARINTATGEATGTVPDIIRELARRLGVPARLIPSPNAAAVSRALADGTADIGFLAFDEERAREVDFGPVFIVMLNSYLVKADSMIRTSADVDRAGVVVGTVTGTSQQSFVSRTLTRARIRLFEETPPQAEMLRLLDSGEVTAFAINRQRSLEAQATASARVRALDDSFLRVDQSVVIPKGNRARLDAIAPMITDMVRSGFVKAAVERAGLTGVEIATAK